MVPDWAPNAHPLVVHFPVALLLVAALADAVALGLRRRHPVLRHVAAALYGLAAVATVATFFTGRAAIDAVTLPLDAVRAANDHADRALWLVWVAGLYGAARIGASFWERSGSLRVHVLLSLLGLVPLVLVQQTAERGGKLVYVHGVGVRAVAPIATAPPDGNASHEPVPGDERHAHDDATPTSGEETRSGAAPTAAAPDGSWTWTAASGALPSDLRVLQGGDVASLGATPGAGALVLRPQRPVLVVAGGPMGDEEVAATLDLSGFTGTAMLVYHARSREDYDFFAIDKPATGQPTVRLGRVAGGRTTVFAEGTQAIAAPVDVTVVAAGRHLRGLVGGALAAHGHAAASAPGATGLRIDGTGPVGLLRLSATPVR